MLKTRYIMPRIGMVNFGPQRKTRTHYARIAMFVMVIVTVILVILTATGRPLFASIPNILMPGVIYVVILSLLAFILDYPRLYAYGWLLTLVHPLSNFMEAQTGSGFPNGFTVAGLVVILVGLTIFMRFMRQHPLPSYETDAGGGRNG